MDAMVRVTLNVDLGELEGEPDELYALADVCNVACGGHAGDAASMRRAITLALRHGAAIAAHPSYPDRARFGRASVAMEGVALAATVEAQCAALGAIAREAGATVAALKPHGALYHDAAREPRIARAVLDGAARALGGLRVVGPPTGALAAEARARGLAYAREGFADRGYRADGALVPRGEPGASIDDAEVAARQATRLASSGAYETLCVHGDGPHAVAIARAVRAVLERSDPPSPPERR
jgi:UPF0271 protein